MKRIPLDLDDLRKRYVEGGVSENALAKLYGVDRGTIRKRLIELGIEPRGRSAALRVRMEQATPEERSRLASAAHAAVRGKRRSDEELSARAARRQRTLEEAARLEFLLADWLRERGLEVTQQVAVERYNVDLAIGSVAVEVHAASGNPARYALTRKRAHDLLDRGWSVVYVWVSYSFVLTERAADEVVAFAKLAERLPSGARQYRVIRGSGEHVLTVRFDPDQDSVIPAPKAFTKTRRKH